MKAKLEHVKKEDADYKLIETYLKETEPSYRKLEIVDVWRVNRDGEVRKETLNTKAYISHLHNGRQNLMPTIM